MWSLWVTVGVTVSHILCLREWDFFQRNETTLLSPFTPGFHWHDVIDVSLTVAVTRP